MYTCSDSNNACPERRRYKEDRRQNLRGLWRRWLFVKSGEIEKRQAHKCREGWCGSIREIACSVEETLAANRSAKTRNAVGAADFALKFVVVGELFVWYGR